MKKILSLFLIAVIFVCTFGGCTAKSESKSDGKKTDQKKTDGRTIAILSGSENKELEPIIEKFTKESGIQVEMTYQGSVDIMNQLKAKAPGYDAVWPANSIWLSMGDDKNVVKHEKSIMSSPIVFGVKKSIAERLNFIGRDVSVRDILEATKSGELRFAMTSATQSNSGACAYLGFLSAMLSKNTPIMPEDLQNETLKEEVRKLLSGVNRSSGSSDWLKDLVVANPDSIDAMVNYESLIIAANKELIGNKKEPLYIIYPYDGMSLSDSPLAYIDNGNGEKEADFLELQNYLCSQDVQKELNALGRRTGITLEVENPEPAVWNEEWGIDTDRTLPFIDLPQKDIIFEALTLYQTVLKKPSATIYCLDYSGSMEGTGREQLTEAARTIFDQEIAAQHMLQNTQDDYTGVLAFSGETIGFMDCYGNKPGDMLSLFDWTASIEPGGATDIYSPIVEAMEKLKSLDDSYMKTIVLMTDGESNEGMDIRQFEEVIKNNTAQVPVFSIMFGEASDRQLSEIARLTAARVFDGRKDMIAAFKQVRGYN